MAISGGNSGTEGAGAVFTLTASPAPDAAITVNVSVTASGDYGVTTGTRTVTISTGGTATLTVATTGDSVDENQAVEAFERLIAYFGVSKTNVHYTAN